MLKYVVMTSDFFAAKLKEWMQTADRYSMLVSLPKLLRKQQDGDCCYC